MFPINQYHILGFSVVSSISFFIYIYWNIYSNLLKQVNDEKDQIPPPDYLQITKDNFVKCYEKEGFNENIKAPVQTANPLNYGGQTLQLGIGINIMLPKGSIGLEAYKPISRDLNGPQMGMNWGMQAGYHLSF